jgi:hypothetical protein
MSKEPLICVIHWLWRRTERARRYLLTLTLFFLVTRQRALVFEMLVTSKTERLLSGSGVRDVRRVLVLQTLTGGLEGME